MSVVNYTWSKQFEQGVMAAGTTTINTSPSTNSGYLNNGFDPEPWRSISGADRTHRLVITTLYDLPFGRGRRMGRDLTGLASVLASGWQIDVIGEIQSGTPTATPNAILLQPTAKLPKGQQSLDQWFDNSTATNRRPDGSYACVPTAHASTSRSAMRSRRWPGRAAASTSSIETGNAPASSAGAPGCSASSRRRSWPKRRTWDRIRTTSH
jgi:hypothetical protein